MSEPVPIIIGGDAPGVPGSIPWPCSGCGREVWLAPSSVYLMMTKAVEAAVCHPCADEMLQPEDDLVITAAQYVELVEAVGAHDADLIIDRMGARRIP